MFLKDCLMSRWSKLFIIECGSQYIDGRTGVDNEMRAFSQPKIFFDILQAGAAN